MLLNAVGEAQPLYLKVPQISCCPSSSHQLYVVHFTIDENINFSSCTPFGYTPSFYLVIMDHASSSILKMCGRVCKKHQGVVNR